MRITGLIALEHRSDLLPTRDFDLCHISERLFDRFENDELEANRTLTAMTFFKIFFSECLVRTKNLVIF